MYWLTQGTVTRMAEYTIKLVDVAAEARERLGDLADTLMPGSDPDWRFVINGKRGGRTIAIDTATANGIAHWLKANNVQPDEIHEYLADDEPPV